MELHELQQLADSGNGEKRGKGRRGLKLLAELRDSYGRRLVVNNTRVLRARLHARRPSGGVVELLVLEPAGLATPLADGIAPAPSDWLCLARPARRLRPGEVLLLERADHPPVPLEIVSVDRASGGRVVRFPPDCTCPEAIEALLEPLAGTILILFADFVHGTVPALTEASHHG
jgi:S-adenosylmethionine:tRNA ribosyltransferase-isomerase